MKKHFFLSVVAGFSILLLGTFSWAQCPEDVNDRGNCDSLIVTCLDCEQTPGTGPWQVRFPLLITHDQTEPDDSIAGFVIPIGWTRTNPSAFCSLSAWWNDVFLFPYPDFLLERSIFRHLETSPGDTIFNRMMRLSERMDYSEWATLIVDVSTDDAYARMSLVATGTADQKWWEGDRTLLATWTFVIEDTMTICMDSTFWPPTGQLLWSRGDAVTYTPRDNLPNCFTVGVPPAPDFTMELDPDSLEIQAGSSDSVDVNLTSLHGFASTCTLEVTNLPPDAYAGFNPDALTPTGTSVLQINTAVTTPAGVCTALVIATEMAKGIVDTAELILNVTPAPDFTIELDPDSLEIQTGSSGNTDVNLTSLHGFASTCTLTITNLPTDASAGFNPDTLTPTGTSVLQINTAMTTPAGVCTALVIATEMAKGIMDTAELILNVTPAPHFTMELDPDSLEIQAGSSDSVDVNLTSLYGFASTCTLTLTNLPPDASASFNPDTLTPTGTSVLQINTAVTTPAGVCTALVIATEMAKGIVDTAELILNVSPPPDFTIEAEPETLDVWPGGSVDGDVILTSLYGFASPLDLSASGLPTDASAGFDPDPATPTDTSVMTITAGGNTPPGTYDITITADEVPPKGAISHSTQVVLLVHQPDFTIEAEPETLEVIQGGQDSCEIILTSLYGFDSPCTLSVSGLPQDASGTFDPDTMVPTDTSTLSITVAGTTPTGVHPLTVTATELVPGKGQVEHNVEVVLVVNPPQDFAIEVLPDTLRMPQGTDSSYTVTLTSLGGFSSPCTLEVSGLPAGVGESFDPPTVAPTGSSELNIFVPDTTETGYYTLTITATEMVGGKELQHSRDVTLVVTLGTWAFYLEAYPDSQWVTEGHDTTFKVVVFPNIGFTAPCTLSLSIVGGMPAGVTYAFDPNPISPNDTSVLTVWTTTSTPTGWHELIINGIVNPKQESTTTVHLEVREETSVEDWTDNPNAPSRFALFQNHPNPFNPETKISYYLPTASYVRLTVYNVLGQKVRTLFDGHQDSGTHTVLWDGRREDGTALSSGIYFYRMQAGDFRETKKMSLMK